MENSALRPVTRRVNIYNVGIPFVSRFTRAVEVLSVVE